MINVATSGTSVGPTVSCLGMTLTGSPVRPAPKGLPPTGESIAFGVTVPGRPGPHHCRYGYFMMLTARAMTRMATRSETDSSSIIMSLAHGLTGDTSVGLKAVAELKERCR